MANFFDDLGKAMTHAVNSVSTEFSVAAQEQRLKEAYQMLGRMYYDAIQRGAEPVGSAFDAQMARINDLLAAIREKRQSQNVTSV